MAFTFRPTDWFANISSRIRDVLRYTPGTPPSFHTLRQPVLTYRINAIIPNCTERPLLQHNQ